jgi:hypothetical protein
VETKAEVRLGGLNLLAGKEVIAAAKAEEATIIVMATASKPLERTLLGSVAFDIFRARQLPVLIYGPSSIAAGLGVPQGGRAS